MLLVGFLEGTGSGRGTVARCADSLTIRRFLGYSLTDETSHHSSLSGVVRRNDEKSYWNYVRKEASLW